MDILSGLFESHPFWIWLALGVILLAAEAATGSGWLLWPAASAGVVGFVLVVTRIDPISQIAIFSVLTVASTFAARKWLVRAPGEHPDINDSHQRLVGQEGRAVQPFEDGHGRAFVGGAEWPADLDRGGKLAAGSKVVVISVSGSRLSVRAG